MVNSPARANAVAEIADREEQIIPTDDESEDGEEGGKETTEEQLLSDEGELNNH